jgi:hypothetical protein
MLHGSDVIGDLFNVIDGNAGDYLIFKQQQIRERRLGPFNLRRQKGFLMDIEIEKETRVG